MGGARQHKRILVISVFFFILSAFSSPTQLVLGFIVPIEQYFNHSGAIANETVNNINQQKLLGNVSVRLESYLARSRGEASKAVRYLVSAGAVGISGSFYSSHALISAETSSLLRTPFITPGAGTNALSDHRTFPYFSRVCLEFVQQAKALIEFVKLYNIKNLAIIATKDLASLVALFYMGLPEDVKVLSLVYWRANDPNVIKLTQNSGARYIFTLLVSSDLPVFAAQAKATGFYGFPYVFMVFIGGITNMVFDPNGDIFIGSFGLSIDTLPNPNIPFAKEFLATLEKYNYNSLDYDSLTQDSIYTLAYAAKSLLDDGMKLEDIRGETLMRSLLNTSFIGATGPISFEPNGNRRNVSVLLSNMVKVNKSSSTINRETRTVAIFNGNGTTQVYAEPIFPNGESTYDDTPGVPIEYFDCQTGRTEIDELGIIKFSDEIIPSDQHCDDVIQCQSQKDEDSSCSPSLRNAEIALLAVTSVMILLVIVSYVLLVIFREKNTVKWFGLGWFTAIGAFSVVGLTSIYPFWGRDDSVHCGFRTWLATLAAAAIITTCCLRQFWWWKDPSPENITNFRIPKRNQLSQFMHNSSSLQYNSNNNNSNSNTGSRDELPHPSNYKSNKTENSQNRKSTNLPSPMSIDGDLSRSVSLTITDRFSRKTLWITSIIFGSVVLLLNIIFLIPLTVDQQSKFENGRCGTWVSLVFVGILIGVNSLPQVIGCVLASLVRINSEFTHTQQTLLLTSQFNSMFLSLFLLILYFSLYDVYFAARLILMIYLVLLFFNTFFIIALPTIYSSIFTKKKRQSF
eukprot:TRINITY_DN4867_c0_g1_i1.p1 TRINITY_DN4867_c0_g1~~TRINITY_DN4867_c0_g1_i1.p1  ORF type:complete len:798 (+),score=52.75 TRINITY_DN4867_c0_g1_i1:41-2434(+)